MPRDDQPARTGTPTALQPVAPSGRRMNRSAVLWVTLAVFAQESVWNFYDAQVPVQLRQYITSAGVVGLVMGMDNVLGVLVQPGMGYLSDRLAGGRLGRWPIITAGACLAAVPFALIPWTVGLPALLACVLGFALIANMFKGVTETLVSDYVAPEHRSRAQGFVKAGVSLTIVVSSLISLLVVDRSLTLAFAIPALLLPAMIGVSWLFLGRRHTRAALVRQPAADGPATPRLSSPWAVVKDLVRDPSRARLLLMLGIFCFAGTWSALRSLLTPYGTEVLGLSRGQAGGLALPGAVAFLLAVVPIAYASRRLGEVRAIQYGIALFLLGLLAGFAVPNGVVTTASMVMTSVGYAAFAVNALVALWNLAPDDRVLGTYTGLYTVASASAAALGPALLGVTVDITGWRFMFLNAAVFGAVALTVFTSLARRRPPVPAAPGNSTGRNGS
ncbi:MFS transporter [Sphaerisporangium album]|uniref:MFS transporter n=1 Tax=Sphaerisporangium album TaxID=509200 RepID=A0A367FP48_9ACTN|nr:MFS transporter [Sphaerisporangium album]RCG32051.1 MFS transporter [Sphaerisporangium album]